MMKIKTITPQPEDEYKPDPLSIINTTITKLDFIKPVIEDEIKNIVNYNYISRTK